MSSFLTQEKDFFITSNQLFNVPKSIMGIIHYRFKQWCTHVGGNVQPSH